MPWVCDQREQLQVDMETTRANGKRLFRDSKSITAVMEASLSNKEKEARIWSRFCISKPENEVS